MSTDWQIPKTDTGFRADAAGPGSKPLTSAKEARELMMRRAQAARRSPAGLGEIRQDAAPARKPVRSAAEARARMIRERRT